MIIAWNNGTIHYKPERLTEKQKEGSFEVTLPEPENNGKVPVLQVDPIGKSLYYKYVDKPSNDYNLTPMEQKLAELEAKIDSVLVKQEELKQANIDTK